MAHGLRKGGSLHVGPNMTPMVDIVMCILIFFMLSMSFASADLYLPNNTPVTERGLSETPPEPGAKTPPTVQNIITLTADGSELKVYWQRQEFAKLSGINEPKADKVKEPRTADEQEKQFREFRNNLGRFLKQKKAEMSKEAQIIIDPDSNVRYQYIIAVYDACMQAQFENIAFRPSKPPKAVTPG